MMMTMRTFLAALLVSTVHSFTPSPHAPQIASPTALLDVKKSFASSLQKLTSWKNAQASAELYMNPATTKITNITVTWEPNMAQTILKLRQESAYPVSRPLVVGVVGIPGSGKSTSSSLLAELLPNSIVMPLDGYHYDMATLQSYPDAVDRIYRRGAPDTFDAAAVERDLQRLCKGDESIVHIPGFDHAVGDPVLDQHTFYRNLHQIVICEGIYVLHPDDGWGGVKEFMDYVIYIDVDIEASVARLKERNKCIPGYTPEQIEVRVEEVDRTNAMTVAATRPLASFHVQSGAA